MMHRIGRSLARRVGLAFIALLLLSPTSFDAQSSALIAAGSTWRYLGDGTDQGVGWRAPLFNDSAWPTGTAQLGYGDGDEATIVGYGPNAAAKHITTYFRRTFSVNAPGQFGSVTLRMLRDDGAVVYLNGSEVFRTNMPSGPVTATTPASTAITGGGETTFVSAAISPSLLVAGTNVIAVEVHQSDPASSDLSFDLELTASASVAVTRGPYLQLGTPTSVVMRWRTTAAVVGRVQFGPSPGVVTGSVQETSARTEHEVRLTGLAPDTLYYYSIGTASQTLAGDATFRFRTAPQAGIEKPVRVWAIGDSGTADANARAVRDAFAAFTGSRRTDVWLMLGDNAYETGLDSEYQTAVFDTYPTLLRQTVLWPAYGNHDGASSDAATNTGPYFNAFTLPKQAEAGGIASGTEAYYSFDYANIHFVCLDSFESSRLPGGAMLTWLQRDLAANTQPWVIAYFHHPPYTRGNHNSDTEIELVQMRQNALPILENFGVDLVLVGHSHAYERSFLLDGHYGDSSTFSAAVAKDLGSGRPDGQGAYNKPSYRMAPHEGAVYLVAGNGGKITGGLLNHPAMYTSQNVLGSVVLDIQGNRLDASFLDNTGARRDYFSIVKGAGGPPPATGPYGGTAAVIPGTLQAENFDEGPANLAYYDTTPGNHSGAYRPTTDVDLEAAADSGGGYNVARTRAGEWLQYTVDITTTGTYTLETRVAVAGSGARFSVAVDGVDRTGPIAVPDTGGWQTWRTLVTPGVALAAGRRTIRVTFVTPTAGGGVGNYNWFRLAAGTPPPTTAPYVSVSLPGIVQAENFDQGAQGHAYFDTSSGNSGGSYRTTNVDIGATGDGGNNEFYVGWTRVGEWLKYTVEVTQSRAYKVHVRVANAGQGAAFRVKVDDNDVTGPIPIPNTGGWDVWSTVTIPDIVLNQGWRQIALEMVARNEGNNGVGNYQYLEFR